MNGLPKGWADASFDAVADVTDFVANGSFAALKENVQYLDDGYAILVRLTDWKKSWQKQFVYVSRASFCFLSKSTLYPDDIVISCVGDPGQVFQVPDLGRPMTLGPNSVRVRELDAALVKTYFAYYWKSAPGQRELAQITTGTTQLKFNKTGLRASNVILPPLPEQKRIADKLDTVLGRVDACRDRLDRIPALLKRFRQSILAAATSGRLTKDSGKSGNEQADWTFERAADVCSKVQSGGTPKEGFTDAGIPFLKVYNIVEQKVDFDYKPQYIDPSIHNGAMKKSKASAGDVLMNIVGPPLGKVAVVPSAHGEWNINQAITLFRPSKRITSEWLYCVLCGGENIADILHETKGSVGQVNISLSQCREFIFPVPPLAKQREIVRRVEILFAFADRLEARLATARKQVGQLTPALLAKAFRGELVPQDPNDEPAAELLKRLAA